MARKAAGKKSKTPKIRDAPPRGQDDNPELIKSELLAKLEYTGITPGERSQMIEELAWYRAEQRGFGPGEELEDWLEAESIVDTMLSETAQDSETMPH